MLEQQPTPAVQEPEIPVLQQPKEETPTSAKEAKAQTKKLFSFSVAPKYIPLSIHFPDLLPGFEPFVFPMKIGLSAELEEKRQEYLSLSAFDMSNQEYSRSLDEMCHLLVKLPTGFADLEDQPGLSPGDNFRYYVENCPSDILPVMKQIVIGGMRIYWGAIIPRTFRT